MALRITTMALGIVLITLLAVTTAFYVQYRLDDHPIALPPPRGPHRVGRMLADWKDARRNRELMVFIWYPAADKATGRICEYLPGKWGELNARNMLPIPARRLQEIQVHSLENAAMADGRMPLLILLPGMGRNPAHYTTIAEDLASFGYVVMGVAPTGSVRPVVFSDGHVDEGTEYDPSTDDLETAHQLIDVWAADADFALDHLQHDAKLAGHINFNRVGIFGHSFGGSAAAQVMELNTKFRQAAILDGTGITLVRTTTTIHRPLLVLEANVPMTPQWKAICDSDPAGAEIVQLSGALHMNFSDAGILPSRFPLPKSWIMLGDVDGTQCLYDVSGRLRLFFDKMQ
jgi:predicted dienelactone hydrolase